MASWIMWFKTQQRQSHNYIALSLHLLTSCLFLEITHRETTNFIVEKLKRAPSFLKNLHSGLSLIMFSKVRQTQKIPGRKFHTFWRFCEEHTDSCQRMLEFWTQMNSILGNRLGTILYTRQMSPVPSPLFMQSPNLEPYSQKIHIYPSLIFLPFTLLLAANFLPFPTTNCEEEKDENWWKEFRNNEKLQMSALKWGNCITDLWDDGGNQKRRQLTVSSWNGDSTSLRINELIYNKTSEVTVFNSDSLHRHGY